MLIKCVVCLSSLHPPHVSIVSQAAPCWSGVHRRQLCTECVGWCGAFSLTAQGRHDNIIGGMFSLRFHLQHSMFFKIFPLVKKIPQPPIRHPSSLCRSIFQLTKIHQNVSHRDGKQSLGIIELILASFWDLASFLVSFFLGQRSVAPEAAANQEPKTYMQQNNNNDNNNLVKSIIIPTFTVVPLVFNTNLSGLKEDFFRALLGISFFSVPSFSWGPPKALF